jgi:ABC-type transporter Mla subunit MlaD
VTGFLVRWRARRGALARIERALDDLASFVKGRLMSQLDDVITAINDATNSLAARVATIQGELTAALEAGTAPTQAQLDELGAIATHLNGIAADPTNPVPATAPTPSAP